MHPISALTVRVLLAFSFCCCGAPQLGSLEAAEPIRPQEVIPLFNGRNLDGLYTWLKDTRYEDPRQVFTVEEGLLHISGDGLGGITTKDEYADYHLVLEYRWGEKTYGDRQQRAKDSGVLVHGIGPDGAYGGIWQASIEAQIIEGGVGDFIVVPGNDEQGQPLPVWIHARVRPDRDGESVWSKEGDVQKFTQGRVNWFGRDEDWSDTLGFRGPRDLDSPGQEWTRFEVICSGDEITVLVNGELANQAFDVHPTQGKITIQSELAELWIRRWELRPLAP